MKGYEKDCVIIDDMYFRCRGKRGRYPFFQGFLPRCLEAGESREQEGVCRFLHHVVRTLSTDVQKCIPGRRGRGVFQQAFH